MVLRNVSRLAGVACLAALLLGGGHRLPAQEQPASQSDGSVRSGFLIQVPLPITEAVAAAVKQQIQRVAEKAPVIVEAAKRPVLILEFDTSNSVTGQGSEIGNCLNIALLLRDAKLRSVHTVAYIPRARGFAADVDRGPASELKGHAVLVALACDEIAMHNDSSIGQAGIDISGDPALELDLYKNIVGGRLPSELAVALVDKSAALHRVETAEGFSFENQQGLDQLDAASKVIGSTTLSGAGELPLFSSETLQRLRLVRNRVSSRRDLAIRMDVDPASVEGNPAAGSEWQAVQLPVNTFVDAREADWTVRMLTSHLNSYPDTNLILVRLNSPGGEMEPCLRVARELAALDPGEVRTVAFVESTAVGPSALIAAACDQVIMTSDARIGGLGDVPVPEQDMEDARPLIRRLAEQKQIDWSVPMGLVDVNLEVGRYSNKRTGQPRLLCEAERLEFGDARDWALLEPLDLTSGLTGKEALRVTMINSTLEDFEQLKQLYQLTETPLELQPSPTDRWIQTLARELAAPWVAAWLLFGAVFLLSTEMSNPGIGIPGFLGTLCLMLFFWSQYLDGNAHWLEILLFVVGLVFIALEVFVVPGFGVFGIGGLLMIVAGIVLASQTFIIPRSSEDWERLPVSLSLVLAAGGGFFAAVFFFRKYLTTMPMFRRIMLNPPGSDDSISPTQREARESLVDRTHLLGQKGVATTPLVPAGKARIGNELVDVITDGRMIERNQPVIVVEVTGNRVLVELGDNS